MTAPSTRPSEAQLHVLRTLEAAYNTTRGRMAAADALRALLDDYEARGAALRECLARLPVGSGGARRISEALGEPDPRKPYKFS